MKMRKWTAILLTVCMLLSLLPGAAFAEGETLTDEITQEETQVCETCGKNPCVCEKDQEETQVCENCGEDPCVCEKDEEETQACEICGKDPCECEETKEETQVCEICGKDPCECEEEPVEELCEHEWNEGEAVEGGTKYTCALCGESHVLADEDNSFEIQTLEETEPQADGVETNGVAQVGNTTYGTLQEAISAANSGTDKTVTMLEDQTVETWNQIWDLNGVTIDGQGYTLTVGSIYSNGNGNYLLYNATNLNIHDLKVILTNGGSGFDVGNSTLSNVSITGAKYGVATGSNVTITGCTFTDNQYAIYTNDRGQGMGVKVTNNTFTGGRAIILRSDEVFTGNTVEHSDTMLSVDTANATVTNNKFSGTGKLSLYADTNMEGNAILCGVKVGNGVTADLSDNYWGENVPTDLPDGITVASRYTVWDEESKTASVPAVGPDAVAEVEGKGYATLQTAIDAAEDGDVVTLVADVEVETAIDATKSITIDGGENKHSVTAVGALNGNSGRVFNINESDGLKVTFQNMKIVGPTTGTYTRGISAYQAKNLELTLNNVELSANYYALNIASLCDNAKVDITDSTLTGWCAFQTHSPKSVITAKNSTLIGINDKGYNADGWNDFQVVVVNELAEESEVLIENCRIEARATTGNRQDIVSVRSTFNEDGTVSEANSTLELKDCEFISTGVDGVQVEPTFSLEKGNTLVLNGKAIVSGHPAIQFSQSAVEEISVAADEEGKVYTTLQAAIEAIPAAGSGTVTLLDSVSGLADITIQNKNVTLDLNGNNITFKPDNSFLVYGTKGNVTLNVTGQGTIESSRDSHYYSTIDVYGYKDATHKTEVTIGKDVTIANDGSYGIALNAVDKKAAGVTINVNGTIAAPYGFSVSGNVKDITEENMPVFNLNETGKMTGYNGAVSTGAVYAAGYAKYNIAGTLEGSAFGIAIKSGTLNVKSGATVSCVGEYAAPTEPYGNGANASGAAIQIEANSSYAGNIQVNVEDGATVKSTNGNAIYQYAKDVASEEKVSAITITGGNFSSGSGEGIATIHVDEQTKTDKKVAISGGTFDEDVSAYCVEGLKAAAKQDESGKWVIVPAGGTVAMVSGVSATKTYESLQAAVDAAQAGDTVTLLTNVTLNTTMDKAAYTSAIMIKKNLTLDGGNNTITVDGPFHGIQVYGNVNVTVKNVTITGAGKDALLVNGGANVTANGLKTSGNAWGAVNVNKASTFTFDEACSFAENNKVWVDGEGSTVTPPEGWNSYTVDGQTFYTNTLTLALNRTTASLYSNTTPNTVTLTATVEGSVEGKAPVVTWTTSNAAVATVADGVVTAVGNGTATITATVGDLTASCTVTVSRYTSGGGGGGSYRPSRPTQPEENLGENDVPLAQPLPFIDVTENDWFYAAVRFVFDKDMIKGTNEAGTLFEPLTTTTRGMIVTILHRLEGEPEADASSFSDVAAGAWYTDAVNWAAASGVVKGMEDGSFHPEDVITREQMAAILSRYATLKGYDKSAKGSLDQFQDRALVSDWAEEDMIWALGAGILKGRGDGVLDPTGTTTRSEAAEMLKNFCEKFEASDEK